MKGKWESLPGSSRTIPLLRGLLSSTPTSHGLQWGWESVGPEPTFSISCLSRPSGVFPAQSMVQMTIVLSQGGNVCSG